MQWKKNKHSDILQDQV